MEQRELLERIYEEVQGLSQRQTVMEQRLQNMENDLRGEMQDMANTLREEISVIRSSSHSSDSSSVRGFFKGPPHCGHTFSSVSNSV